MKNIALIGFMGAGKSTVAEALRENYGFQIVEMDAELVKREQMPISQIFAEKGEPYFRDLETKLLEELQAQKNTVISCGGGVPLREVNVAVMRKNSRVVWLCASAETILARVKDSHDRPLLEGKKDVSSIQALMDSRREKYEAAADIRVQTDEKSAEKIAEEIMAAMKNE